MIAHPVRDRGRVVGADGVYLDLADYTDASVQASVDNHIRAFREHSAVIEQAKGMIMIVYGVSAERAFEVLSWRSQTGNTKLSAVCAPTSSPPAPRYVLATTCAKSSISSSSPPAHPSGTTSPPHPTKPSQAVPSQAVPGHERRSVLVSPG